MDSTVRDWSASSRVRAARPEAPSCFTRSLSGLTHFSQMNQLHLIILVYLYSTVNGLRDGESREARLARRQQHPAYKRALSNLHLQFISEFLAEKPLVQPTTDSELWSFDPSGLGDETHFSLWWLLPSLTFLFIIIILFTIITQKNTPAQHVRLSSTV